MDKEVIKSALAAIPTDDFLEKTKDLLSTLGYSSDLTQELSGQVDDFIDEFEAPNPNTKTEQEFREHVDSIQIVFQFTKDEIVDDPQLSLLEAASFDKGNTQCFLFCVVELKEKNYSRTKYADFTREINKRFFAPTVVFFRVADRLTVAFAERRPHKIQQDYDVLEQVTLIKDIRLNNPHRAHLDILSELSLEQCVKWMDDNKKPKTFDGLLAAWIAKLDTEELNKQFYRKLFAWFEWAVEDGKFPTDENRVLNPEEHVIRLITRLLFIWFIKEKGLIAEELFNRAQVQDLLEEDDFQQDDSYYRVVLQNLFFATLNTEIDMRKFSTVGYSTNRDFSRFRYKAQMKEPDKQVELFAKTPFINGGLFDCLDSWEATGEKSYRIDCFSDNQFHKLSIPNHLFFDANRGLIPLLQHYKFTVEENTPVDQEVALDPELLGRVFENLLAAYNPETGATVRKQTGSYYTPRAIVDYMVEETLVASLSQKCQPTDGGNSGEKLNDDKLRYLFDYRNLYDDPELTLDDTNTETVVRAISEHKILDPAVGSGAFPMGVLHKLTLALRRLDPDNTRWEQLQKELAGKRAAEAFDTPNQQERDAELSEISQTFEHYRDSDFGRKLYLIQNSIFGVDIQPVACQIAKLRFFISLAIEQEPNEQVENFGIKPLPNLETRFIAANTLIGLTEQRPLTSITAQRLEGELRDNREQHFHATTRQRKRKCKETDERLRHELAEELESLGFPAEDARKIAQWDLYDQNATADWFDPEWMFGIMTGFDVVIGNPPYVSHDKIAEQQKAHIKKNYDSYQSFADLYCYFIEKALELQSKNGILCFITSNSYLRAEYGSPIRRLLLRQNILLQMLNVENSQVFESAIVNVAIIMSRKMAISTADCCIVVNSTFSGKDFIDFVKISGFNYPQTYFNSKSWNLAQPKFVQLQKKLESSGKTLEQLGTKIRLGIATGSNEAFLIDKTKKRAFCKNNNSNAEIIKPILRGRDITRYNYTLSEQYIILAKNGVNVERDYPDIYGHLDSFGDKFKSRGAQGQHWTNLRACSFYDDFKKEKIVWIELSDLGRFALCTEEVYLLNSAYFLLPPSDIDSRYLLGILNSKTIHFYLSNVAETSGMGTSRWINNYVKEFPIPTTTYEQQTEIIEIVNEIIDNIQTDPDSDTTSLENEIDVRVYELYDLTPEEIRIVGEGTS